MKLKIENTTNKHARACVLGIYALSGEHSIVNFKTGEGVLISIEGEIGEYHIFNEADLKVLEGVYVFQSIHIKSNKQIYSFHSFVEDAGGSVFLQNHYVQSTDKLLRIAGILDIYTSFIFRLEPKQVIEFELIKKQ